MGTLLTPTVIERPFVMELSVHRCPGVLLKDMRRIFPTLVEVDLAQLLVVPTFQPSKHDLVSMGTHIEDEKDCLLERFMEWAEPIVKALAAKGFWCDYTDPTSGYPMHSERGASSYPDVQGTQTLLKYEIFNAGSCTLIAHPRWRTRAYPATLFTTAPLEVLLGVLGLSAPAGR